VTEYIANITHSFSVYNTGYNCQNTPSITGSVHYLNLPNVREAIHAANKTWESCNSTILDALSAELVTPPAYGILPDLLERGLCVHVYSGDQDFLLNHIGTELIIQNMTWYVPFFGVCLVQSQTGVPLTSMDDIDSSLARLP